MKKNKIFYAIAALIAAVYFGLVWYFTVNIPTGEDDFCAIQNFIVRFIQTSDITDKALLFIEQHVEEHRVAFTKVVTFLVYLFSGKISYSTDIFIGCILLFGIALLMYKMVNNNNKNKGFIMLMICILIFNGQSLSSSCWALTSLANTGTIFLVFMTIFLFVKQNNKFSLIAGFFISILTVFSNGSGLFVTPTILICLFLQKRYKTSAVYLAVMAIAIVAYFTNYNQPVRTDIKLNVLTANIYTVLKHFCMIAGMNFWTQSFRFISLIAGLFYLFVYFFGIWKKWYKKHMFCYACLTYLYLSIGALSVAWLNSEVIFASYYRIYCTPILIITLLLIINNYPSIMEHRKILISCFIFLFGYYSFSTIYIYKENKSKERNSLLALHYNETSIYELADGINLMYLKEAEQMGIYKVPKYPFSYYVSPIKTVPENFSHNNNISYKIEKVTEKDNYVIIKGWAFIPNHSMTLSNTYICIGDYICETMSRHPENKTLPKESFFFVAIDKNCIKSGDYTLGIRIKRLFDRTDYFVETEESVNL